MAEQSTVLQLSAAMDDIPAPIYQRVKLAIIRQIRTGTWQPHQRVPSESELVTELGVSRMTINRALRELTNEGFLIRMQGVGTFVAEAKAHSALLEVLILPMKSPPVVTAIAVKFCIWRLALQAPKKPSR